MGVWVVWCYTVGKSYLGVWVLGRDAGDGAGAGVLPQVGAGG